MNISIIEAPETVNLGANCGAKCGNPYDLHPAIAADEAISDNPEPPLSED